MALKSWILGLVFMLGIWSWAIPSSAQETAESASPGEILFSVGLPERPPEGRHHVKPEQDIQICLKLNPAAFPYFETLQKGMIGYRLILEDSADPPHVLVMAPGNRLIRMKLDANGCYPGTFTLPQYVPSGVYQVADLLLAREDQSLYSVRDALYSFAQVDELEIQNPDSDTTPPELLRISNHPYKGQKVRVSGRQLKIMAKQVFFFKDDVSGLDSDTLKVNYALAVDGQTTSYARAHCKPTRPDGRYYCRLHMVRPLEEWSPRFVSLTLDSISLKDKAGNQLSLQAPSDWEAQAKDATTRFEYVPQERTGKNGTFLLQKQALY